jgi:MFS family permease
MSYGILFYSFGVFTTPIEAELGFSRAQSSLAFSMALLVAGLVAIPVGRYVDKHGARAVMTLGSVLATVLLIAWSQVQSLAGFYLVWLGLGLTMSAVLYEVAFTVIAVWFDASRQRAMLLITLIAGLASTIFIPLETYLITQLGWRQALWVLAGLLAITIPLHAVFLRHKSHQHKETMVSDARAVFRTQRFWWFVIAIATVRIAASAMSAHTVPLLLERGHTAALVAVMAGGVGLMQLVGRIFFTPMTSKQSLFTLSIWTFGIHALGLIFLFLPSILSVWVFVVLFGASNGAITLARAGLLADIYGSKHYGQLSGVIALATSMVGALAPLVAGLLHDFTGGYKIVLGILILTTLSSMIMMTRVRRVI